MVAHNRRPLFLFFIGCYPLAKEYSIKVDKQPNTIHLFVSHILHIDVFHSVPEAFFFRLKFITFSLKILFYFRLQILMVYTHIIQQWVTASVPRDLLQSVSANNRRVIYIWKSKFFGFTNIQIWKFFLAMSVDSSWAEHWNFINLFREIFSIQLKNVPIPF